MTKTIAVTYSKGGFAKTTTTLNLGFDLALRGYKVCIVDLDYNAYLTSYFDIDTQSIDNSIFEIMKGMCKPQDAIIPLKFPKKATRSMSYNPDNVVFDLIPCKKSFADITEEIIRRKRRTEYMLKDSMMDFIKSDEYDFILFDCPPSEARLKTNILAMVDYVILVCTPSVAAVAGFEIAAEEIVTAKQYDNPELEVLGIVACSVNNTAEHKWGIEQIKEQELFHAFETPIRNCSAVGQSAGMCKPLQYYKASSTVSVDYESLTTEVLDLMNMAQNK